ncbi:MAG: FAD-binding protein [Helicobacteraceae bacterium]|jgi:glycolate oxidase|nr:FAD-binding protein [Helicobacteraceae bacterium]
MLSRNHYDALVKIVGSDNCYIDQAHRQAYSYDATRQSFEPEAVVFPRNEGDIQQVLRYANQNKIPVVPRGAGSGFTGGSLSVEGGIVLALEKYMNQILEIDLENMLARVQPAVINKELQNAVEAQGLFYPPDPASQEYSTIGGNVSENAGGMRAAKYGITKNYVLALRAVLANGELIRAGKKTIKDVAGFNIAGLLTASEGSLAVITEITLKLIPKPKLALTAMGFFSSVSDAMNATYKSFINGVTPVAMEFLDNLTIRAVESAYKKGLPIDAGALLIAEVDGNTEADIKWQIETVERVFRENGCSAFIIAKNNTERDAIWFARRNASQSLKIYGPTKLNEDITVPRSALPELLKRIALIGEKYDHQIPCFGHTGDGNVHVNVMTNRQDALRYHNAERAIKEIFEAAIELEGTLSGEHGIGVSKAPFMDMAFSQSEMNLFRTIKKALDPNNILNPGKMGL